MNEPDSIEVKRLKDRVIHRHLLTGWSTLLIFLLLGLVLEICLAFKVDIYTRADQITFRLMWRLAHGHGTLLALVHLAFSFTLGRLSWKQFPQPAGLLSVSLIVSTVLIPGGFFLAAFGSQAGDPSAAIALVPVGAVLLIACVGWLVIQVYRDARGTR
jgi:hypothetical protein